MSPFQDEILGSCVELISDFWPARSWGSSCGFSVAENRRQYLCLPPERWLKGLAFELVC